jgi:hypothetical protein
MTPQSIARSCLRWSAAGAGVAAAAYAVYAGVTWVRYGHPPPPAPGEADDLLDRFMPVYDVVDRHHVAVAAPVETTLAVARAMNLFDGPVVRAVFKGRELILRSTPTTGARARGLIAEAQSLGWVVLDEIPGREMVFGAVTRPWEADVTFRPVPAGEYLAFGDPDYVKIVWTIRADSAGPGRSIFRTETRALATDPAARAKFRRYWSCLSPGIILIRRAMLGSVRRDAERASRAGRVQRIPSRERSTGNRPKEGLGFLGD